MTTLSEHKITVSGDASVPPQALAPKPGMPVAKCGYTIRYEIGRRAMIFTAPTLEGAVALKRLYEAPPLQ
jgi:hypothetical protein